MGVYINFFNIDSIGVIQLLCKKLFIIYSFIEKRGPQFNNNYMLNEILHSLTLTKL